MGTNARQCLGLLSCRVLGIASRRTASEQTALERCDRVAVLGGGTFGTAMASLLARNKPSMDVALVLRDASVEREVNELHSNSKYLPDYTLPHSIRATTEPAQILPHAQYIVLALPVQRSRGVLEGLRDVIPPDVPILSLSKGLEVGTSSMMSQLIQSSLCRSQPFAVLSGPSFAVVRSLALLLPI